MSWRSWSAIAIGGFSWRWGLCCCTWSTSWCFNHVWSHSLYHRSLGQALKFLIVQKMISLYVCLFKHGIFGHFQNCNFAVQPIFFLSWSKGSIISVWPVNWYRSSYTCLHFFRLPAVWRTHGKPGSIRLYIVAMRPLYSSSSMPHTISSTKKCELHVHVIRLAFPILMKCLWWTFAP